MDKTELRTILKEKRFALSPEQRKNYSDRILEYLVAETARYQVIMPYAAKIPEVETMPYICRMIDTGKTVVLPIIEKETHTLRLSRLESPDDLSVSTFQVPEPVGHELPVSASAVECIILPMVGFDRTGNRLGYGAGYYDRFLAANPQAYTIGLAFSCQEFSEIPADRYDIRMREIITESGIIRF